ncbi:hypothetical protein [Blastomonas sp.]|uniref:hypothetical protein n=1 Tax=Blastomonas sp. TaxID=1909299 RepID=UPI0035935C8C
MDGGFSDATPSHLAKPIAALLFTEYILDPASHPVDRLIPFFELTQHFMFVAAPHAGGDDLRYAARCTHRVKEVVAAIGTVGKFAGIVGLRFGTCSASIDTGLIVASSGETRPPRFDCERFGGGAGLAELIAATCVFP